MDFSRIYDYLLTGVTGQVGRYLLRALMDYGTVVVVMRRPSDLVAKNELAVITNRSVAGIAIVLGDINTCQLPVARCIVNAAGFTRFVGRAQTYWDSNIMPAIRLAHHARTIGAAFHQLSSVAVAEFRDDVLAETDDPIPDERQLLYSTSKVMVELAVSAILPSAQIFRLGDVVPPVEQFDQDWRSTHWLPILFACGKRGFEHAPSGYKVWLADTEELVNALLLLMDRPGQRYHLLGNSYSWAFFRKNALATGVLSDSMSKWMTDIILHGPEASMVTGDFTVKELAKEGFAWTNLDSEYWKLFAERSLQSRSERRSTWS